MGDPGGEWVCDGCGRHCGDHEMPFTCTQGCDFDHCLLCHMKQEKAGEASMAPPSLALVDMDFDSYYTFPEGEVTSERLDDFVASFEAGTLAATRSQLSLLVPVAPPQWSSSD